MYRRDSDGILVPMPSSGSGGTATPPTASNPPPKAKRINNSSTNYQNIPEYFDGYFPQVKPTPGEYYGKYELEISPQSQRICGSQLMQQNQNLPHHQPQPQQNHATNYYNHNPHSHLEANCNAHYQAQPFSVNYPTQQNDYELGAPHVNSHQQHHTTTNQTYGSNYPNYPNQDFEMGSSGAGQNYGYPNFQSDKLEMAHYESGNGEYTSYPNYQNYPNYPSEEPTRPNPNFNFANVPVVAQAAVSTVVPPPLPQQQPFPQPQPHNHIQQPHNNTLVENSTDFNFLSNIANDFVPEYYQLS